MSFEAKAYPLIEFVLVSLLAALVVGEGIVLVTFPSDFRVYRRAVEVLTLLHQNWKAVAALSIPLLFWTVRSFLEEVKYYKGMDRGQQRLEPNGETTQNPESTPGAAS